MNKELYERIKAKHGKHASWAIWNISPSVLRDYDNIPPKTKEKINPNIVMMGYCIPGKIEEDFKNFHYPNYEEDTTNDGKLRCAFEGTEYEGAYMTNVIKYNKRNAPEQENIKSLKEELEFIGSKNPLIIALGEQTFSILKRNGFNEMYKLIWIYWPNFPKDKYSHLSKYREKVLEMIKEQLPK
jgi:hypothetical protein